MLEAKDFADALNAAPDAILIVDSGGRIEFASERVSAIFGYAAGEIVDTCVDGLLPEPYRAAHAVQRATFAKVPVPRAMGSGLRLYGRHRDGSSVPVEISLAPLPTGNGTKVICSIRNAALHRNIEDQLRNRIEAGETRLQQSEAESRQQRELLRLFMTHMPGAAAMLDADLRYLAVTPSWLRDYGLGERDVLGKSHYEIFPEIPERWRTIHRRALAGESLSAIDDASTFQAIMTCWSIFGPVDSLGRWPFGKRGDHEEDAIYGRADGQDSARGGQGARGGGGQEARGQRRHDLRVAQALWAA